jgi:hypothetical protein
LKVGEAVGNTKLGKDVGAKLDLKDGLDEGSVVGLFSATVNENNKAMIIISKQ